MISAFLDAAKSSALVALMLIERCHGVFCRSGGALGHGTGPWDDVTGVVKRAIVDNFSENYVDQCVRENQSMYWQPTETRLAGCEPIMKRQRAPPNSEAGDAKPAGCLNSIECTSILSALAPSLPQSVVIYTTDFSAYGAARFDSWQVASLPDNFSM
jgi:hypothetical protein